AGSSALVRQIEQGSPADAFISADEQNMHKALKLPEFSNVTDREEPRIVATNQLVLAVAANPKTETNTPEDRGRGARVATGAPAPPTTPSRPSRNTPRPTSTLPRTWPRAPASPSAPRRFRAARSPSKRSRRPAAHRSSWRTPPRRPTSRTSPPRSPPARWTRA